MSRGQLPVIIPPSTPTQRQNEVAEVPPHTKSRPSNAKRTQERDRPHRRPKRSRLSRTTSHSIYSRSSDWRLSFANAQSLDPWRCEIKWYVNNFIPGSSSKYAPRCNTDLSTVSNQIPSVPGRDQSSLQKSSDHAVDPGAAPESKSNWNSTAYAATKLAINIVKESSDVFPPLKSVVGGLSAILDHCEVRWISPRLCRPWYSQLS